MKRKLLIIGLLAVVLAGGFFWIRSSITQKVAAVAKSQYATARVRRGPVDLVVTGTASIVPYEKVTVKANVMGTIAKIFVEAGQPVKQGQPVMLISNEPLAQQLAQARVDYESQKHKLETMRSPSAVDRQAAEVRVQQAQNNLENRRKELEKLAIVSPIRGRVASVKVNPGDAVSPPQLLVSIVDDTVVYVMAQIPQSEIAKVKVGQRATVAFGSELPATEGIVDSIGVEASTSGRTTVVPVAVKVLNPNGIYRIGLSGNVTIRTGQDETVSAGGPVAAKARYDLRAEVSGNVDSVHVRDNDSVESGQLLVKLKNDSIQVAVKQAEADLEAALDSLNKIKSGLVPNIAESDTKQQEFRVRQAEIALRAKSVEVDYLEPRAPFDGTIVSRHVTRGDMVNIGTPLFTIADYSRMKMIIAVDELDVAKIRPGQKATVRVEAVGRTFEGTVTRIAGEGIVKDGVAQYEVEVTLSDTRDLRGGMTGTARIEVAHKDNVLVVPSEAVRTEGGSTSVLVLRDGKAVSVPVTVGLASATLTEIISGLSEGDEVVLSSFSDMSPFTTTSGRQPGGK